MRFSVCKGSTLVLGVILISLTVYFVLRPEIKEGLRFVKSVRDVVALFPKTVNHIERGTKAYIKEAKKRVKEIIAIPDPERTYANTMQPLDNLFARSDLFVWSNAVETIEMVSPEKAIRDAAHKANLTMRSFFVDLAMNYELYKAVQGYAEGAAVDQDLSDEQRRFITETMDDYKRLGMHLPEQERDQVKRIQKELTELSAKFDQNIADDQSQIIVDKDGLAGLDDDFIESLKRTDDGRYILGIDYPTYFNVMDNCSVAQTRKDLYLAFTNRAYPANDTVLRQVIAKRDELAQLLGFESFAHLNLDDQMVKSPERAHRFLDELIERSRAKGQQEFAILAKHLPDGVVLTAEGKFEPWDFGYTKNQYKKNNLAVDELKIAEYFPMENTIKGLLSVYEKFLGIHFDEVPVKGLWTNDARMLEVYDAEMQLIGYLILDLFPRKNKYSHACEIGIVKASYSGKSHKPNPGVAVVLANFPKPTKEKPSLLERSFVRTFFHEFGHALHELLGRTKVASFAGTSVKTDFVEMPSQMLEEWLWDKDILKMVSGHYQTGEPLPDELLDKILAIKHFDTGNWVLRQAQFSKLALEYFKQGPEKDTDAIRKNLSEAIVDYIRVVPDTHFQASFGHLMGYGAKYYGYLWAKVFALDLFYHIKEHGLLDTPTGQRYIQTIIGHGGSKDPDQLLVDFLGREPNSDAFFKDLGL